LSNIISEAYAISKDLKDVVMVGAVAVMLQTKRSRTSYDIDVALATDISHDTLIGLGYIPVKGKRDSWDSPRGVKVDIYRNDVSGIPVSEILETCTVLNEKTSKEVKVACLEVLIIAKYRAFNSSDRPNDREDLKTIVKKCLNKIDWNRLERLCSTQLEYNEITKMLGNLKKLG